MNATPIKEEVDSEGRQSFKYQGRTVYKWKQSLEEVLMYIDCPPGVSTKAIDCKITVTHLTLGLKGNPPFIDEDFTSSVVEGESYWMVVDNVIEINLQKAFQGETWASALKGHGTLNPFSEEKVKKEMMLERFQRENPGFDFSGAEFNGQIPDPRGFMGGIKTTK